MTDDVSSRKAGMASSSSSSRGGGSSHRPKSCEICFESYGVLGGEAVQLFCCTKLLCCLCVKGILSEQASRCPWCYRKWIERGFYRKSKVVTVGSAAGAGRCDDDGDEGSNPAASRIVTAASGEIKREYESIREKAMSELRHQLRVDEEIAKRLYADEQRAAEQKKLEEAADSAFAMHLSQDKSAVAAALPPAKVRAAGPSAKSSLRDHRGAQRTLFDFVTKAVAPAPARGSQTPPYPAIRALGSSTTWACAACTFVNSRKRFTEVCEVCGVHSAGSAGGAGKKARVDDEKENQVYCVK